ncbi:MAG: hypothetical protein QG656_1651, partial [Candidatus Hydrogenedentes bacterium]|nr:hypothetical protein [Candidatus Hydrogenedentota bacterium]
GDIMGDFEREFVRPSVGAEAEGTVGADVTKEELIKTRLGVIAGVAFFAFGLAIVFGGPLVDLLGMGNLLRLAAAFHIGGTLLTIFAPSYWIVVIATLIVGAGNGIVEAVCNPLIATLYPEEKTHKLTLFHAWFPGGIVIGGLLAYAFSQLGLNWQLKMGLLLIPAIVYTIMILGQKFPATERVAAGVPFSEMFSEAVRRPLFWILAIMMWFTAASELGTGAWISNIYNDVMGRKEGILALVWGSILMYILRQFFSKTAHRLSPVTLIAVTAPFTAAGLVLFNYAAEIKSVPLFFAAATLVYFGVCFWWPTMLGITTERCPRTGALGLGIIGGIGSFATFFAAPLIGWLNDTYGPGPALQRWAILPIILCVVFAAIALSDKARGGYKIEKIGGSDS